MLTLRRLDAAGLRAYLYDLRPRLLVLRVRSGRVRFVWMVPMAPLEQVLGFALALALLAAPALRLLPGGARRRAAGPLARVDRAARECLPAGAGAAAEVPDGLPARLSLIAAGGLGEALRLPPGVPYLTLKAKGVAIDVRPY